MKQLLATTLAFCALSLFLPLQADAGSACRSGFRVYKHGNYRCTLGRKDQCVNGKWKYKGKCKFFGRFCHHGTANFKHGQIRCIDGRKSKCKRGKWKTIGKCPLYCLDKGKLYNQGSVICKPRGSTMLKFYCKKWRRIARWRMTNKRCCVYKGKTYNVKQKANINGKWKTCFGKFWK